MLFMSFAGQDDPHGHLAEEGPVTGGCIGPLQGRTLALAPKWLARKDAEIKHGLGPFPRQAWYDVRAILETLSIA